MLENGIPGSITLSLPRLFGILEETVHGKSKSATVMVPGGICGVVSRCPEMFVSKGVEDFLRTYIIHEIWGILFCSRKMF